MTYKVLMCLVQAMQNLRNVSEEEAKKTFVQRIRKLETFGQSFFSVTVSKYHCV